MPDDKKLYKLTDLVIGKIDLVDSPANPGARVVLFKRADEESAADFICEPVLKAEDAEAASFDEALAETEGRAKAWEVMDQIHPLMDALHNSVMSIYESEKGDSRKSKLKESVAQFLKETKSRLSEIGKAKITANQITKIQADIQRRKEGEDMDEKEVQKLIDAAVEKATQPLTEKLTTLTTENESMRKRLAGVAPSVEPDKTPVTKADLEKLDPASREAVEKAVSDAKDLREKVAKMEHEHAVAVEAIRIEKKYPNLPEDPKQAAADLLSIPAENTEARERFEKRLEMANTAVEKAITPYGIDGNPNQPEGGDAFTKLQKQQHEIMKAQKIPATEAWDMACTQNPELAAEYKEER